MDLGQSTHQQFLWRPYGRWPQSFCAHQLSRVPRGLLQPTWLCTFSSSCCLECSSSSRPWFSLWSRRSTRLRWPRSRKIRSSLAQWQCPIPIRRGRRPRTAACHSRCWCGKSGIGPGCNLCSWSWSVALWYRGHRRRLPTDLACLCFWTSKPISINLVPQRRFHELVRHA